MFNILPLLLVYQSSISSNEIVQVLYELDFPLLFNGFYKLEEFGVFLLDSRLRVVILSNYYVVRVVLFAFGIYVGRALLCFVFLSPSELQDACRRLGYDHFFYDVLVRGLHAVQAIHFLELFKFPAVDVEEVDHIKNSVLWIVKVLVQSFSENLPSELLLNSSHMYMAAEMAGFANVTLLQLGLAVLLIIFKAPLLHFYATQIFKSSELLLIVLGLVLHRRAADF